MTWNPNAARPAVEADFGAFYGELFGENKQLQTLRHDVDNHRLAIGYHVDEDGYAGWSTNSRLIGIDYDLAENSVFCETFYFARDDLQLVRFRATPLARLIEKVIVVEGTPSLPLPIEPDTHTQYWWHLHDMTERGYPSSPFQRREELKRYAEVSGSQRIRKFLGEMVLKYKI